MTVFFINNKIYFYDQYKKNMNKKTCHDCHKEIINGFELIYDDHGEKIKIFKCQDCYQKNSRLTNFRKCEVYSRVVGYLRPVSQWHPGKKDEFENRKEFILKTGNLLEPWIKEVPGIKEEVLEKTKRKMM